jgi:hypothetical protein
MWSLKELRGEVLSEESQSRKPRCNLMWHMVMIYEKLWRSKIFHGDLWQTRMYRIDPRWQVVFYHDIIWSFTFQYCDPWWSTMVPDYPWGCMMFRGDLIRSQQESGSNRHDVLRKNCQKVKTVRVSNCGIRRGSLVWDLQSCHSVSLEICRNVLGVPEIQSAT